MLSIQFREFADGPWRTYSDESAELLADTPLIYSGAPLESEALAKSYAIHLTERSKRDHRVIDETGETRAFYLGNRRRHWPIMSFEELTIMLETASKARREEVIHQYFDKIERFDGQGVLMQSEIPKPLHATLAKMVERGEVVGNLPGYRRKPRP